MGLTDSGGSGLHNGANWFSSPVWILGCYPVIGYGGLEDQTNFTVFHLAEKGIVDLIKPRKVSLNSQGCIS